LSRVDTMLPLNAHPTKAPEKEDKRYTISCNRKRSQTGLICHTEPTSTSGEFS
jgi:hypothetical protein